MKTEKQIEYDVRKKIDTHINDHVLRLQAKRRQIAKLIAKAQGEDKKIYDAVFHETEGAYVEVKKVRDSL